MANSIVFNHPVLGALKGRTINERFFQLSNIPYGTIQQRFGRSRLVTKLPTDRNNEAYDATQTPPASVQPKDAAKTDCKGNQLPTDIVEGYQEEQSEDCLRLNITLPASTKPSSSLPVVVFLHGGAYFIGSGTRPYYKPLNFCEQALLANRPHIFVSMNYRLGALGFFHSHEANDLVLANNGLHDQSVGFQWIRQFIEGFGGDRENISAIGQSAGAMSLTIHNLSGQENVWKRSVQFSGSLVTMPVQTPAQHQQNFLSQATKLGIETKDRSSEDIARDLISLPVDKIRDAGYVGLPCSQSEKLPYETASMALTRRRPPPASSGLESQIVSSATYDGGISYNMLLGDDSRRNHASAFIKIAQDVLREPQALLDIYEISPEDEDTVTLRKICQFESDIGFFAASLSQAQGFPGKTYLIIFDLGNPFEGPLPVKQCATHTWDIVALLGACEHKLDDEYRSVIADFRSKIISYTIAGEEPWPAWTEEKGTALRVSRDGLQVVEREEYMGKKSRRGRLLALAEKEAGEDGCDVLWSDVCRRFLMKGE